MRAFYVILLVVRTRHPAYTREVPAAGRMPPGFRVAPEKDNEGRPPVSAALAAVGAVIAALIEFTIASRFQIADAQIHIVFIFAVVVTIAVGFEEGMAWAFFGGLTADLLTRPLGSTVFALLLVVGGAAVLSRVLARNYWLGPVLGVFALSFVYLVVLHMLSSFLQPPASSISFARLPIAALVNAIATVVIVPPFALWRRRIALRERIVW